MTFFISPSVSVIENDATLDVTEISDNIGALSGTFQWGPAFIPTLITQGEGELATRFGKPNDDTYISFLVGADYLSYSSKLLVSRAVGLAAKNAVSSPQVAVLVKNELELENANLTGIDFLAKYPGVLGNGIRIDICDETSFPTWEFKNAFDYTPVGDEFAVAVIDGSGVWSGSGAAKQIEKLTITGAVSGTGTSIDVLGETVTVVNGDTPDIVATKIAAELVLSAEFENVTADKGTVSYTSKVVGKQAVQATPIDQKGLTFTVTVYQSGRLGTLLEKYELLSNDRTAKLSNGSTQYFIDVINKQSKYIAIGDKAISLTKKTVTLAGGVDDNVGVNLTEAFDDFVNGEQYDINYLIAGAATIAEQKALVDVADTRRDCIAYLSPEMEDVVNNKGNELAAVVDWRLTETNKESSYAFNDCNWAYVYDKYNDTYRWIPCCGGTAGLKARTDRDYDPWISPAGHERGRYKNYVKLAWSPNQAQRDELYKIAINPVVSFPGEGILLYGDKTSLQRPSSFGHINVRSAFIVAEKSIANFAKYFLFEINDAFTQAQFLNATRPFLRNMKSRRAWEEFKVVCDLTNNDGSIRQGGKLVGSIWLKPTHSINYVILEFNAVRSDVEFTESQAL